MCLLNVDNQVLKSKILLIPVKFQWTNSQTLFKCYSNAMQVLKEKRRFWKKNEHPYSPRWMPHRPDTASVPCHLYTENWMIKDLWPLISWSSVSRKQPSALPLQCSLKHQTVEGARLSAVHWEAESAASQSSLDVNWLSDVSRQWTLALCGCYAFRLQVNKIINAHVFTSKKICMHFFFFFF